MNWEKKYCTLSVLKENENSSLSTKILVSTSKEIDNLFFIPFHLRKFKALSVQEVKANIGIQ